jgi:hypothetical protein
MAAWTTLRAPNVGEISGKFLYTTPEKISGWHLRHPAYTASGGVTVEQKWGKGLSLILSTTRAGIYAGGEQYKKKIVQKKYLSGQNEVLETSTFWLPVLFECDPIVYEKENKPWSLEVPHGSSTSGVNSAVAVWHLPLVATNDTITDTYRLGQQSNIFNPDNANYLRIGNAGGVKPGVHVSNFGGFDYYWSDDTTDPDFQIGTVVSTGPAKVVGGNGTNFSPYPNTIFSAYGKGVNAAKLYPGKDLGQLYEWSSMTVNGKTITPGTPFTSPGQTSGQYLYSAYAIRTTAQTEMPSRLLPIIVSATDYTQISNWKSASSVVAVAPNVAAAVAPNLDLNQYMTAGKDIFATGNVNGVQTVQNWTSGAGAEFVNKYIVYPSFKLQKVGGAWTSQTQTAVDSQARFTAVGLGSTTTYQPATGQHLGAYNSLSEANQWRDYYNSIIKAKVVDSILSLTGYVFAVGNTWNDGWMVLFNVEGMSGIRSKDSLSKNYTAPKVITGTSDDAVDLPPSEANQGAPSIRVTAKQAVTLITKNNVQSLTNSIMATEKLTFKQAAAKFKEEFIKARIKLLVSQGIPAPTATARANARAAVLFDDVKNSNPGGAGTTGSGPSIPTTIRIPITRGLIGYQPPPSADGMEPQLVQKYQYVKVTEGENGAKTQTLVPTERRFKFPFAPKDVSYTGLSSVWTEINRTGRHPIVDWSGFQLLKVSFTFELVDKTSIDASQPRDGFGFYYSVDEKINLLRQMATAPYPVSFLNMDTFFDKELRYPLYTQGRGVEFVITDFAVQSVQRTPPSNEGPVVASLPNQISRASCTMTLQECPIEQVDIVNIPPIYVCPKTKCPPVPCKVPCTEVNGEWLTISQLLQ